MYSLTVRLIRTCLIVVVMAAAEAPLARADEPTAETLSGVGSPVQPKDLPAAKGAPTTPMKEDLCWGMILKANPHEVVVEAVSPNTPAAAAGVAPADIVLAIGGQRAYPLDELAPYLTKLVRTSRPEEAIPISILRQGKPLTLVLVRSQKGPGPDQKGPEQESSAAGITPSGAAAKIVGLELRDMSRNSVTVLNVAAGSPAALAGIEAGDMLLTADSVSIAEAQQFIAVLGAHRLGDAIDLQLSRGNAPFMTKLLLTPRLFDLAAVTLDQASIAANQQVAAQQQAINELRLQLDNMQLQLKAADANRLTGSKP
jgi:S1-C subfamily serine protease